MGNEVISLFSSFISKDLVTYFENLGITIKDSNGNFKTLFEILDELDWNQLRHLDYIEE